MPLEESVCLRERSGEREQQEKRAHGDTNIYFILVSFFFFFSFRFLFSSVNAFFFFFSCLLSSMQMRRAAFYCLRACLFPLFTSIFICIFSSLW